MKTCFSRYCFFFVELICLGFRVSWRILTCLLPKGGGENLNSRSTYDVKTFKLWKIICYRCKCCWHITCTAYERDTVLGQSFCGRRFFGLLLLLWLLWWANREQKHSKPCIFKKSTEDKGKKESDVQGITGWAGNRVSFQSASFCSRSKLHYRIWTIRAKLKGYYYNNMCVWMCERVCVIVCVYVLCIYI